jgi:hypothetical protein
VLWLTLLVLAEPELGEVVLGGRRVPGSPQAIVVISAS